MLESGEPDAVQIEAPDDHLGVVVGGVGGWEGMGGRGGAVSGGRHSLERYLTISMGVGCG